jgi:hypothetical protein
VIVFPVYAARFDVYPKRGTAFDHLAGLFQRLKRVDFSFRVNDPSVNQGQMESDFDDQLEAELQRLGATQCDCQMSSRVPQQLDFTFNFAGKSVAVEIEKANREKILRDILKSHMYLSAGADFAVIGLPRNYAHTRGIWDLFDFGISRLSECGTYGFGRPELLSRILLLGFTQYDAETGFELDSAWRKRKRQEAAER